ncbi:hypothetical protein LK542_11370 [Massilia sp. IC2-477]|uniref:hypothetical protein n=1 Tax=Massilia sp. IC2-477 TaxID=2887198 RepID=UPI001D126501|nr:hypothetical protein [Massilia sp. IC2-477]MCC2956214.1 hypothetical protein [Massilia sp. IC2-477]
MRSATYQPAGRVPVQTGLALVFSCCCGAFGAFLYAFVTLADRWCLSILLTWAFAFWLVLVVRAACLLAKVRNPGLMRQFGLVVGMSAWLVQWIFWIVLACYDGVREMPGQSIAMAITDLFSTPGALSQGFAAAGAVAGWTNHLDDQFLRAVAWLVELGMLLLMPQQAGFAQAGKPFCEASGQWVTPICLPQEFAGVTLLKAREHLVRHPEALLAALSPLNSQRNCHAKVVLYAGRAETFISVEVTEIRSDGGRAWQRHHTIVEHLRVPARAVDHFMGRLSQELRVEPAPADKHAKRGRSGKGKRAGQSSQGEKPAPTS